MQLFNDRPAIGLWLLLLAVVSCLPACSHSQEDRLLPYVINLQFVDESGQPMTDVTIQTEQLLQGYNSAKSTAHSPDGSVHMKAIAHWIDLNVSKAGYHDVSVRLGDDFLGAWARRTDDPATIRLTMYKQDDSVQPNGAFVQDLTVTGRIGDPVIDLDRLGQDDPAFIRITANNPTPKNALYATPDRAADGTTSLTLHFTLPDAGFAAFSPQPFNDPFAQMRTAPSGGYAPTFTLSAKRLAELALCDQIPAHEQFLFFHVGNRFGRLRIQGDRSQHPHVSDGITFNCYIILLPPDVATFPPGIICGCH